MGKQLTPLEFLDKVSVLIPPPKSHLQHYHGVFASNAPMRKIITAHANRLLEEHVPELPQVGITPNLRKSYSWAKLLARIYEVFPLICSCGDAMKIIAIITNPHTARHILTQLKFCTNPFDPVPFEPEEWENGSQLVPECRQAFSQVQEYAQEPEYDISQVVPDTEDGFGSLCWLCGAIMA